MSDIFLSYALDDMDEAEKLRDAFQQQEWTVWWDSSTVYGGEYTEEVDRRLKDAKVIVVLWSRRTRKSSFVAETFGHKGAAFPVIVRLDKTALPVSLVPLQRFYLLDWDSAESHAELQKLLRYISALLAPASPPAKRPVSFQELSLSEIQENARRGIKEAGLSRPKDDARFKGVFISYRRSEAAAYAGRLYDRLAARFGKEQVFIDTENVGWGEDFVEAITSAAESCAVMIALVSPRWSRGAGGQEEVDDYVRLEVATALGRKIRVIPILIQGASMPAPKELPEDLSPLARRNALALSDTRWERDVEDLMKSLEGLLKD